MEEQKMDIDSLCVAALRSLVIDVINKANSGHPGMALDAAPMMYALYRDHLKAGPEHPDWINRDRLVYSAGHPSALIYSLLHLSGYSLSLEDLQRFRQLHSLTPGHPEVTLTRGIDATAGPLGQGIGQAVGMAIAEKAVSAQYPEGSRLLDHYTYCLCGDGCLEEGISQEAISLAGHLKLNKLILLYDENGSTLDGPTSNSLTESVKLRFLAEEWNVLEVSSGNDVEAISKAIGEAKQSALYPTVIIVHTTIGYGSAKQGTHATHGAPLGEEDGRHAKDVYGFHYPDWTVPEEVYAHFKETFASRGKEAYEAYQNESDAYEAEHPEDYARFANAMSRNLAPYIQNLSFEEKKEASRASSGRLLSDYFNAIPFLFGGSADVAASVKTGVKGAVDFSATHPEGRNVNWGIREFGMACACNGILLHGGLVPYAGCFLIFADYLKPAIRMAAMEELPMIYLFSHDSLAVGEDGTTHQPIEQLSMLRTIPGVKVIRPADSYETSLAYQAALSSKKNPTCLILTRQALPMLPVKDPKGVEKGAYFVKKFEKEDGEILATGSEVSLALDSSALLEEKGLRLSVVSLPCLENFDACTEDYRKSILSSPYEKRVSLEMGSTALWGKYAANRIGVDAFGTSGKAEDVLSEYGFTPEKVAEKIAQMLK